MENKILIPQHLFDELIEYFDNKSDADNGTPNKEMKLLSQLQEEHSLRESKGCEVVANEVFADNGEHSHWELINTKNGQIICSESSNSTDELRKEVERLKRFIERYFRDNIAHKFYDEEEVEHHWQQFKETHNL